MNKAKEYSCLGAILGAGAAFGIWIWILSGPLWIVLLSIGFCGLLSVLCCIRNEDYAAAAATYFGFLMFTFFLKCCAVEGLDAGDKLASTDKLALIILFVIPFATIVGFYGYELGKSIGEKIEEEERKRKEYEQKMKEFELKLKQWKEKGYDVSELEEMLK